MCAEGRRRARGTPVPARHLGRPTRRTCARRVRRPVRSFWYGVSLRGRPARHVRAAPSVGRTRRRPSAVRAGQVRQQDRETPPHAHRGELRSPSGERLRKSRRRLCPTTTARTGAGRGRPVSTAASRRRPRGGRIDVPKARHGGARKGTIRPGRAPSVPGSRGARGPRGPAGPVVGGPRRAVRVVVEAAGEPGRGGGKSGVSPWTAFVLTEVREVGTLRPCAWGVPWLACVPSNRKASRNRPPQSAPFPPRGGNLQHSTHPTAWVGDVSG